MTGGSDASGHDARAASAPVLPELRFRLPGLWWRIPLHERAAARASIRRLVDRQLGRDGHAVTLRNELRSGLLAAVDGAMKGGGQSMHVALTMGKTASFPASFVVFLPPLRLTPAMGPAPAAVMDVLDEGLATIGAADRATARRFTAHESEVLRVHRRQLVDAPAQKGAAQKGAAQEGAAQRDAAQRGTSPLEALVVDYWMTIPGSRRVIVVTFSTAFAELEGVMLTLFDSIIRATSWHHPR